MFNGFSDKTIDFMWGVRFNNERAWFEEHKEEYKSCLERPMKDLGEQVLEALSEGAKDLDLKLKVSRIYRDMRRAHGLGPYKDHLWFCIREPAQEWMDKAVFWFELMPESWSYGLGYYCAKASSMEVFRKEIDSDPKKLEKLVRDFNSQSEFMLEGENYVRPKGDPGKLLFDWYNKRKFSLIHEQPNGEEIFSPKLAERLINGYKLLMPFYRYLRFLENKVI